MIKILINGALGRMGKKVYEATQSEDKVTAVCGVDIKSDFGSALLQYAQGTKSWDDVKSTFVNRWKSESR